MHPFLLPTSVNCVLVESSSLLQKGVVKKTQTVSSNVAQHVCFIWVLVCNNSMAVKESFLHVQPFLFQSVYRGPHHSDCSTVCSYINALQ